MRGGGEGETAQRARDWGRETENALGQRERETEKRRNSVWKESLTNKGIYVCACVSVSVHLIYCKFWQCFSPVCWSRAHVLPKSCFLLHTGTYGASQEKLYYIAMHENVWNHSACKPEVLMLQSHSGKQWLETAAWPELLRLCGMKFQSHFFLNSCFGDGDQVSHHSPSVSGHLRSHSGAWY